jgi:hypothetical protein
MSAAGLVAIKYMLSSLWIGEVNRFAALSVAPLTAPGGTD